MIQKAVETEGDDSKKAAVVFEEEEAVAENKEEWDQKIAP